MAGNWNRQSGNWGAKRSGGTGRFTSAPNKSPSTTIFEQKSRDFGTGRFAESSSSIQEKVSKALKSASAKTGAFGAKDARK